MTAGATLLTGKNNDWDPDATISENKYDDDSTSYEGFKMYRTQSVSPRIGECWLNLGHGGGTGL
jgi:hypothetical protein